MEDPSWIITPLFAKLLRKARQEKTMKGSHYREQRFPDLQSNEHQVRLFFFGMMVFARVRTNCHQKKVKQLQEDFQMS